MQPAASLSHAVTPNVPTTPSEPLSRSEPTIAGRRLTDRILEAFTHAYGQGAKDVALALLNALERAENGGRDCRIERRGANSLTQADLWVVFVDARDAYNRIATDETPDPARVERALARMKTAYRHWSDATPSESS